MFKIFNTMFGSFDTQANFQVYAIYRTVSIQTKYPKNETSFSTTTVTTDTTTTTTNAFYLQKY